MDGTSPCLAGPLEAADFWTDFFPPIAEGPFPDPDINCPAVCTTWAKTCKGIATTAANCLTGSFTRIAALLQAECKTITDPVERNTCIAEVQAGVNAFAGELKADNGDAKVFCNEQEATCVAECLAAHAAP